MGRKGEPEMLDYRQRSSPSPCLPFTVSVSLVSRRHSTYGYQAL